MPHCKTMLGRHRFSVAVPCDWNSLPLGLKTNHDSLRGFKTSLKTYLFRGYYITSQCHSAPLITVISLYLWHFINYITYFVCCQKTAVDTEKRNFYSFL